jgi:hypothetical protein
MIDSTSPATTSGSIFFNLPVVIFIDLRPYAQLIAVLTFILVGPEHPLRCGCD